MSFAAKFPCPRITLGDLGLQPSLHAAYQQASLNVSFQALYGKVGRTEPSVLRAMVRGSYERLAPVVENWAVRARRLVPGHRVRIFDGNDLPASEKRLALLRGFRGAALPGQSLVVYDPDLDLVVDALPWADAHDHERTLMKEMMAEVQPGDINVADRADESTEDGKEVVRILTNVPKRLLDAKRVAEIYRKRWSSKRRDREPWCGRKWSESPAQTQREGCPAQSQPPYHVERAGSKPQSPGRA